MTKTSQQTNAAGSALHCQIDEDFTFLSFDKDVLITDQSDSIKFLMDPGGSPGLGSEDSARATQNQDARQARLYPVPVPRVGCCFSRHKTQPTDRRTVALRFTRQPGTRETVSGFLSGKLLDTGCLQGVPKRGDRGGMGPARPCTLGGVGPPARRSDVRITRPSPSPIGVRFRFIR
jgi:hypothetical protein